MLSKKNCVLIQLLISTSLMTMILCNGCSSIQSGQDLTISDGTDVSGGGSIPIRPNDKRSFEMPTDAEILYFIKQLTTTNSAKIAETLIQEVEKKNAGIPSPKHEICEYLIKKIREKPIQDELRKKNVEINKLEENIKLEDPSQSFSIGGGLENISGNDCFMNAALQAAVRTALLDSTKKITDSNLTVEQGDKLKNAYRSLAYSLTTGRRVPNSDLGVIRETLTLVDAREFKSGRQADSSEALVKLIGLMKSDNVCFREGYNLQCKMCNLTWDAPAQDAIHLILSFQGKTDMQGIFDQHFKKETLTGNDKLQCSNCSKRQDTERHLVLKSIPKTLIVTLNRFDYNAVSGRPKKIFTKVENVGELTIRKEHQGPGTTNTKYRLAAAIIHTGVYESGHYYSIVKGADGVWIKYDDIVVTNNVNQDDHMKNAYVYVYERE